MSQIIIAALRYSDGCRVFHDGYEGACEVRYGQICHMWRRRECSRTLTSAGDDVQAGLLPLGMRRIGRKVDSWRRRGGAVFDGERCLASSAGKYFKHQSGCSCTKHFLSPLPFLSSSSTNNCTPSGLGSATSTSPPTHWDPE